MRSSIFIVLMLVLSSATWADERERSICGLIKEPLTFWFWRSAAPDPDASRVSGLKFVEATTFKTSDSKTLSGFQYLSNDGRGHRTKSKGYILMALGNAMISDQIISHLRKFSEQGYDVYIFDYRGYGYSEGKRRINAIIEDYKEIISFLNKRYERKLLYGVSLGGAVVLNAIGSGVDYDAAVIDSSPSLLSEYGCPERIDPVANLPENSGKLLVITGKKDSVLTEDMTSLLRIEAKKRGASVIDAEEYAHPFMDQSLRVHNKRLQTVLDYLVGASSEVGNE